MKFLKALPKILLLIIGPTPFTASYGIGGLRLKSPAKQAEKASKAHDCSGRTNTLNQQTKTLKELTKKVAWYQDRDNSMIDIDINEDSIDGEVGRAMATVFAINGAKSQSIQVCPGVYLATAHGTLDNPYKARRQGRSVRKPSKHFVGAHTYPLSDDKYMLASSDNNFISPRLRDPKNWKKDNTDYVFIKVDKPLRPNDFIEPINATPEELAATQNKVSTSLYRGKTLYKQNSKNSIDFDGYLKPNFNELKSLYNKPQRVKQKCKTAKHKDDGFSMTDCPFEKRVSGGPLVTNVNNKPYLSGIAMRALFKNISSFEKDGKKGKNPGSTFLNSSEFCSDYKKACNKSCPNLKATVSQQSGASI